MPPNLFPRRRGDHFTPGGKILRADQEKSWKILSAAEADSGWMAPHGPARGWLQSMTPAIALDGREQAWVTLDPADGSPLADPDFNRYPD